MENKIKTTAKDFFLHLASMVALYVSVGSLMNLLFRVINYAFPPVASGYGFFYGSSDIAMPVATLIVVFPLFVVFSRLILSDIALDQEKSSIGIRKWLIYLTLFVSGAILAGSLVTVLYRFLSGQELTTGFLLKVLSWFVVAGTVFGYYLKEIRERLSSMERRKWFYGALVLVLAAIVLGFSVIGSPRAQRLMRYDGQKVSDLQNIQNQITSFYQQKGRLPADLNEVKDSLSYFTIPNDSQSGKPYEYNKNSPNTFELCAEFNRNSPPQGKAMVTIPVYYSGAQNDNWQYKQGHFCFDRKIDPDRYPPFNKPL